MGTSFLRNSVTLISTGILAEHSTFRHGTPDEPVSKDEMDRRTEAALKRQLQLMSLQILSSQEASETPTMRQRRLCRWLYAVLLGELQSTRSARRIDAIHKSLPESRAQHPEILKIAEQLDELIQNQKLDLIEHLVEGLKHPERSKIVVTKELIDAVTSRRKKGKDQT